MGRTTWDKFLANDVTVSYTKPKFDVDRPLFILHREFEITAADAQWLAGALTSRTTFKARVPVFLTAWAADPAHKYVHGLKKLATAIKGGLLDGKTTWRFCVTPIPPDTLPSKIRPATSYLFEIRFVMEPLAAFKKARLSKADVAAALEGLGQEDGRARQPFYDALDPLTNYYPDHSKLLNEVFPF